MTAINHALTGALIGLSISGPVLAVVLAFTSHFVLDAIPHYGSRLPEAVYLLSRQFKLLLFTDIGLCILLTLFIAFKQPHHWLLAASCAFISTLPDAIYAPMFFDKRTTKKGAFVRWSQKIQWYERPPGAIVEVAWAIAAIFLLAAKV